MKQNNYNPPQKKKPLLSMQCYYLQEAKLSCLQEFLT